MKENLVEIFSNVQPSVNRELRAEIISGEPAAEILGGIREFSRSKRWFRDTRPIPDVG